MTSRPKHCAVFNCTVSSVSNPEIKLFNFPRGANVERYRKWVDFSKNPKVITRELARPYICARHFKDSQFRTVLKSALVFHAVPTKYFDEIPSKYKTKEIDRNKSIVNDNMKSLSYSAKNHSKPEYVGFNGCQYLQSFPISNTSEKLESKNSTVLSVLDYPSNLPTPSNNNKYEIGVTVVKRIDKDADVESLKKLLRKQVDQVFESFTCNKVFNLEKKTLVVNPIRSTSNTLGDKTNINTNNFLSDSENNEFFDENSSDNHNNEQGCIKSSSYNTMVENVEPMMTNPGYITVHNPILCSKCGMMLKNEYCFSNHNRIHHKKHECEQCKLMLPSIFEYRRHRRKHKREFFKLQKRQKRRNECHCEICNMDYKNVLQLQRHKLSMHNVGDYFCCSICNKRCKSSYQLYAHTKRIHDKEIVREICPYCGRKFASSLSFSSHLSKVHLNTNRYQCMFCNKWFRSLHHLKIHIASHTNGVNQAEHETAKLILNLWVIEKAYLCMICKVKFTDVDRLIQHMDVHKHDDEVNVIFSTDEDERLKCFSCCRFLKSEKDLAIHRVFFHKEIPYMCNKENCGETFWSSWHLRVHNISTHISRSYTCEICLSTFSDRKEKKIHIVHCQEQLKNSNSEHLDNFAFKCLLCDNACESVSALSEHIQDHNNFCFDPEISDIMNNVIEETVIGNVTEEQGVFTNDLLDYSSVGETVIENLTEKQGAFTNDLLDYCSVGETVIENLTEKQKAFTNDLLDYCSVGETVIENLIEEGVFTNDLSNNCSVGETVIENLIEEGLFKNDLSNNCSVGETVIENLIEKGVFTNNLSNNCSVGETVIENLIEEGLFKNDLSNNCSVGETVIENLIKEQGVFTNDLSHYCSDGFPCSGCEGNVLEEIELHDSVFNEDELADSIFEEVELHRNQPQESMPEEFKFLESVIQEVELQGTVLQEVELSETVFDEADLQEAAFEESNLQNSVFNEVEVQGTGFEEVELQGTVFEEVEFDKTVFEELEKYIM